jgi:adhesin transport system outer membrane protein
MLQPICKRVSDDFRHYRIKAFDTHGCFFLAVSGAVAENLSFQQQVAIILDEHPRIASAKQIVSSVGQGVRVAEKAWFPNLSVTGSRANEDRNNVSGTDDTQNNSNDVKFTLTQPIYDFGSKRNKIEIARLQLLRAEKILQLTKQSIILEIGIAQIGVSTAIEKLRYAERSLLNLKKQTNLEDLKVKAGAGVLTDVLQAKVQLAGARARFEAAKGIFATQEHRYRAVFGDLQNDFLKPRKIKLQIEDLPETKREALEVARKNSLQIQTLSDTVSISRTAVSETQSDQLWPKINFIVDKSYKKNVGGTLGKAQELVAKIQFTYNLNLGFSALNSVDAARANFSATQKQLDDARRLVDEAVSNAFVAYRQAEINAELLAEQSALSGAFLELARKERTLGKRSLIEILAGETAEINAKSDAAEARGSIASTSLALLSAMGILEARHLALE